MDKSQQDNIIEKVNNGLLESIKLGREFEHNFFVKGIFLVL